MSASPVQEYPQEYPLDDHPHEHFHDNVKQGSESHSPPAHQHQSTQPSVLLSIPAPGLVGAGEAGGELEEKPKVKRAYRSRPGAVASGPGTGRRGRRWGDPQIVNPEGTLTKADAAAVTKETLWDIMPSQWTASEKEGSHKALRKRIQDLVREKDIQVAWAAIENGKWTIKKTSWSAIKRSSAGQTVMKEVTEQFPYLRKYKDGWAAEEAFSKVVLSMSASMSAKLGRRGEKGDIDEDLVKEVMGEFYTTTPPTAAGQYVTPQNLSHSSMDGPGRRQQKRVFAQGHAHGGRSESGSESGGDEDFRRWRESMMGDSSLDEPERRSVEPRIPSDDEGGLTFKPRAPASGPTYPSHSTRPRPQPYPTASARRSKHQAVSRISEGEDEDEEMEVDELAEDYEDEEDFYSSPRVHASSRNSRHGNGHVQGEGYRNGVREEVAVTARGHPFHQFLPEPFPAPPPSKEIEDDSPRAVPALPPAAAQTTVRRSASVSTSRPGTAGDTANGPRPRPSISTSSSASAQPASAPPRSVPLLPPHLPSMHLPPSMMNSSIPPALLPPSLPSPPPGPPLQQKVMQDGRHYGALRPPGDSPLGYFKTPDGREFYFAEGVRMDRESFWQYFGYN